MSQSQKKSTATQEQAAPSMQQGGPEAGMGNGAAVEDAGIESSGPAQNPKAHLDELLGDPESDPFDIATAYVQLSDFHKVECMELNEGGLMKAAAGDDVAWSMIEGSYQTAVANRQDLLKEMMADDAALQEGIVATVDAVMADHSEGLRVMAELNFEAGELKYADQALQQPKSAARSVRVGETLERALGTTDVMLSIEGSQARGLFSNLEMGSVYSNQTVEGTGSVVVGLQDRVGVEVSTPTSVQAVSTVAQQLPGVGTVGVPEFQR